MKERVSALVLAGSRSGGDPLARTAGIEHKALIQIGERTMLEHVVGALRASPGIGRIAVSSGTALPLTDDRVSWIPAESSPSRSVRAAIESLGTPLLVTTADHALLRAEWIAYFLEHRPSAGAVAALARSEVVLAAQPDTERTFLRFRGGAYSGCNLFLFTDRGALGVIDFWQRIETHRKHPLRMARLLGPMSVLRFALGRLTLNEALRKLGERSGTTLGVVEMPFGESAIDVDDEGDLELVRRIAAERANRRDGI